MTNINITRARNLLERIQLAVLDEDFESAAEDADQLLDVAARILIGHPSEEDLKELNPILAELADTAGWPFNKETNA